MHASFLLNSTLECMFCVKAVISSWFFFRIMSVFQSVEFLDHVFMFESAKCFQPNISITITPRSNPQTKFQSVSVNTQFLFQISKIMPIYLHVSIANSKRHIVPHKTTQKHIFTSGFKSPAPPCVSFPARFMSNFFPHRPLSRV